MSKEFKFKIGDKVRRISNSHPKLKVGDVHIVKYVRGSGRLGAITLEGVGDVWSPHNFELVTEEDDLKNELSRKKLYSPLTVQQAGDHYKKKGIQPIEYGLANELSFPQINIVKYITRHEDKNGLDDLAKSIHYHFFEALRVYGEEGSDELRKKVLNLLEFEGKE